MRHTYTGADIYNGETIHTPTRGGTLYHLHDDHKFFGRRERDLKVLP